MQKIGRVVIVVLALLGGSCSVAWFLGHASGRKEMMVEAVKQNHGHYRITDEIGSTVFEWGPGVSGTPGAPGSVPPK